MLAIFERSVAECPDCLEDPPRTNSVSAGDTSKTLTSHFATTFGDMLFCPLDPTALFVHSRSGAPLHRPQFGYDAHGRFCLYQRLMPDMGSLQQGFKLKQMHNGARIVIQASRMLDSKSLKTPKRVVKHMFTTGTFHLYEKGSKLVIFARASSGSLPLYWGIDSGSRLVISTDETNVKQVSPSPSLFPEGQVYIRCQGRTDLQALFMLIEKNQAGAPESSHLRVHPDILVVSACLQYVLLLVLEW